MLKFTKKKQPHTKFSLPIFPELTSSVVKIESDSSDPASEEKSDHLYEIVDSDVSSNGGGSPRLVGGDFEDNLPETVNVLQHANGAKVYLVGTAHFSKESQEDVSFVSNSVIVKIKKKKTALKFYNFFD